MSLSFSALNLNGIEALLSGVSLCSMSEPLLCHRVVENVRHAGCLEARWALRATALSLKGASFDAMVGGGGLEKLMPRWA